MKNGPRRAAVVRPCYRVVGLVESRRVIAYRTSVDKTNTMFSYTNRRRCQSTSTLRTPGARDDGPREIGSPLRASDVVTVLEFGESTGGDARERSSSTTFEKK